MVRTLTPREGELAGVGSSRLLEDAQRAFAGGVTLLIVDLHHVPLLDARGGGTLVRLARLAPEHARLVLVGLAPAVRVIAQALRLGALFELHENTAEALRAAS
jgi:anti-anti-sigma regulatory factor